MSVAFLLGLLTTPGHAALSAADDPAGATTTAPAEPTTTAPAQATEKDRPPAASEKDSATTKPGQASEQPATSQPAAEQADEDTPDATTQPETARADDANGDKADVAKAESERKDEGEGENEDAFNTPQVEIFIPSMTKLAGAARHSHTASIFQAVSGMIVLPSAETDGEAFDVAALLALLEQMSTWPDTSVAATTYTQDREGRPRWAIRFDWPLEELCARLGELLKSGSGAKILKDVALRDCDDGTYKLELPDIELAVLTADGDGSLVRASAKLRPPPTVFGRPAPTTQAAQTQPSKKKKKKRSLIYCRLNLDTGEDDGGDSLFSRISGVSDIRYGATLRKNGQWSERFSVRWHPVVGMFLKAVFKKTKKPFDCPREAYVVSAFNLGLAEGLADAVSGLPPLTIGTRASSEVAFAAVPGTGFFPFPDLFFQFNASNRGRIIESIRKVIEKETQKRKEDDMPPAWHEEEIDGKTVFWHDPAAEQGYGIMPVTYRTVIFFDTRESDDDSARCRLIIAQTSTWADDVVRHWKRLTRGKKSRIAIPDSKKAHWQARINWMRVYDLAQPYLSILAGFQEDAVLPPTADELADALPDSVVNVRIEFAGFRARLRGPIPAGAFFIPAVAVASLRATNDPSSEASRERAACRRLRVLYHHAKLFKKDYGRWPATVAELDGYIDFAIHPNLLSLRAKDQSFVEGLASIFTSKKETEEKAEDDDEVVDDSLYEIEWSPDAWTLKFREGEFVDYVTITIDAEGEIHRVPKPDSDAPGEPEEEKKAA